MSKVEVYVVVDGVRVYQSSISGLDEIGLVRVVAKGVLADAVSKIDSLIPDATPGQHAPDGLT